MKNVLSIIVFSLLFGISCTKDNTPDLLPGKWYGEYQHEVSEEFNGNTFHKTYTSKITVEITYLSSSKSYDAEVTDLMGIPEPPATNKTIFQFHLNGNKIIFDSGDYFLFDGSRIQSVDEKNLIIEIGTTVYNKVYYNGSSTTRVYPDIVHFRRQ